MSAPGDDSRRADVDPGFASADQSASLARRLGALLYEALLLCAMAFALGFLFLPLVSPGVGRNSVPTIPPVFARTMLFCALAGAAAIYYTWSWTEGRRTLPQKTWRLRIVDAAGRPLARKTALLRYAAGWIGPGAALVAYAVLRPTGHAAYAAALFAFNYAWALIDRDRQFLHDRLSGTRIVRSR